MWKGKSENEGQDRGGNQRCIINLDGKQRKRTDERKGSEMSCSSEMDKYMSLNSTYSSFFAPLLVPWLIFLIQWPMWGKRGVLKSADVNTPNASLIKRKQIWPTFSSLTWPTRRELEPAAKGSKRNIWITSSPQVQPSHPHRLPKHRCVKAYTLDKYSLPNKWLIYSYKLPRVKHKKCIKMFYLNNLSTPVINQSLGWFN